jgi:HEPN domain-containing protein/predicted nucleotidyltransferase
MRTSTDLPLDAIVQRIVERVRPLRVVLFGSQARGDTHDRSDIDLMVEIASGPASDARLEIHQSLSGFKLDVDLHVYTPDRVAAEQDDPGRVMYAIAREGRVLYDDGSPHPAPQVPLRVCEPYRPPDSLEDLLRNAGDDLLTIERVMVAAPVPWGVVTFHAEQAAEKYLKALLVSRWIHPSPTHELKVLLEQCRQAGFALPGLDDACVFLHKEAVEPRYGPARDERTGRAARDAALRIVAAVKPLLPHSA